MAMPKPTDVFQAAEVSVVLVIEKEAVFHSVLNSQNWGHLSQICVVLTVGLPTTNILLSFTPRFFSAQAKGYPDLASRVFLNRLIAAVPSKPNRTTTVFGLADFDPDGMSILLTYKHGSLQLAHEGTAAMTARLQWLGCRSNDISGKVGDLQQSGLRQLTGRDFAKAINMLDWPYLEEGSTDDLWRRELQVMLMLGYKFEIEMVESSVDSLQQRLQMTLSAVAPDAIESQDD
ncbi:MAG: hypothetical protein Q9159_005531 [Coniocarpon cinnabarinum]